MPLPSNIKSLPLADQAMFIHATQQEIMEAEAWAHKSLSAGERVKIRAKITEQKKRVWQAKHGR
jgi:ribosomal protein L19